MNSEERLAKLFELARTVEPEMPLDVLEKHIKNSGTNTPIIKKLFNPKFIYIMVATTLIGAGLYYFFMIAHDKKNGVKITYNQEQSLTYLENEKRDSSESIPALKFKQIKETTNRVKSEFS